MKYSAVLLLAFCAVVFGQSRYPTTKRPTHPHPPTTYSPPTPPPIHLHPQSLTFSISARGLPSKDAHSKADAFVKVFLKSGNEETRLGTTEVAQDQENPEWSAVFKVDYKPRTNQKLWLVIRDNDVLARDDDIGEAVISLDDYVSQNQDVVVPVQGGGALRVQGTTPFQFKLFARNIPNLDTFNGKSDPYVEVYWRRGNGVDHLISATSVINNEANPDWPEVIDFANYRRGTEQFLHFKVYDDDGISRDDFIGSAIVDADLFVVKKANVLEKLNDAAGNPTDVRLGGVAV